jgi:hypothetical protein
LEVRIAIAGGAKKSALEKKNATNLVSELDFVCVQPTISLSQGMWKLTSSTAGSCGATMKLESICLCPAESQESTTYQCTSLRQKKRGTP